MDMGSSETPLGPGGMEGWWVRVRSSGGVCQIAGHGGHLEIPSRPERVFTSSPRRWHGGFDDSELSAERRGRGQLRKLHCGQEEAGMGFCMSRNQ